MGGTTDVEIAAERNVDGNWKCIMIGPLGETLYSFVSFLNGVGMEKRELSDAAIDLIANRFRLLAEPMRLKILHTLGEGEMSVSELVAATGANQANVSKHLSFLLDAGIVSRRKDGLRSNYRVTDESTFALCDVVCSQLQTQFDQQRSVLANTRTKAK